MKSAISSERSCSDDDSITDKAESFSERTVGDRIIIESRKKKGENGFFINAPMIEMNMKTNIKIR